MSANERYILFVSRNSPASARAVAALPKVKAEALGASAVVEIVDVAASPEIADAHRIVATPTLLRIYPPPAKRIVGDLTDATLVRSVMSQPRLEDGHAKRASSEPREER